MTTLSTDSFTDLREILRDLQLLALTTALPSAPEACRELAEVEDQLSGLLTLGIEFPSPAA